MIHWFGPQWPFLRYILRRSKLDHDYSLIYPVDVSPLARRCNDEDTVTDRFELFIASREMANGFSELNDSDDQRGRLVAQAQAKAADDVDEHDTHGQFRRTQKPGGNRPEGSSYRIRKHEGFTNLLRRKREKDRSKVPKVDRAPPQSEGGYA